MPDLKEPHFFGSDLRSEKFIRDELAYQRLFHGNDAVRFMGEASVYYLYSRTAAAEIHRFNPAAKVIMMLRNPVDMIHSLHSQAVSSANEDILDFAEALKAEEDRKRGARIPDIADFPQGLLYRDIGAYVQQVKRFQQYFGSRQIKIILFDDFTQHPNKIYEEVLRFLGVEKVDFKVEFLIVNENRRLISEKLEHFMKRRTGIRRVLKNATPFLYSFLYSAFRGLNARKAVRQQMSPELRAALGEEFAPAVSELATIIDRDLSDWAAPQ